MYGLSFSETFFTGEVDIYEVEASDRPTSVYQALVSLDKKTRLGIARDILKSPHPVMACMAEDFEFEVLSIIRETDLCDDLSSPVTVYIDADQNYSVLVYDEEQEEDLSW